MLLAERKAPAAGTHWEYFVDCFRLSLPAGSSGVSAKVTYSFSFEAYHHTMISDLSGKYYAAYFRKSLADLTLDPGAIHIWDIETGKAIRRITGPFFHESPGVIITDIMVVAKQGPHGPQQVMISGSDHLNIDGSDSQSHEAGNLTIKPPDRWLREWCSRTELKVFPIGDGPPGWDGYVKQVRRCRPSIFKLPRSPAGIAVADDPATLEYESEKIGLAFWGMDRSGSGIAISSYHYLTPDEHAGASRVPLTADGECRIYCKTSEGEDPPPFVVQRRSGLSFTLDYTPRESCVPLRPHGYKYLTLHSFHPSTTPGLLELEWKAYIRSWDNSGSIQAYYNGFRERPPPFQDICGDEFATAFVQYREGRLYVVLAVWDEPFQEM